MLPKLADAERLFLALRSDGKHADAPAWYPLVRAARYLNCPPWELLDRPQWWIAAANQAENAENRARAYRNRAAD